jgi:hypothetical protein
MENNILNIKKDVIQLISSSSFLKTPSWSTFFYYAKDRESLMEMYDIMMDEGFTSLEQPHSLGEDIFLAKLVDQKGRHIILRSN